MKLWEALGKHLPEGWRAWHSLRLKTRASWEGEGDFVIVDPERGLLLLEVKGGRIELRDGRWFQDGKEMKVPPRDQAQSFVKNLVGRLGGERPPFGVACVFPDCEFSEGPTNGDLDGLVIGARELPYLGEVLVRLFERAVRPGVLPSSPAWIDKLHSLWGETWVPKLSLRDRVSSTQEKIVQLDEEQLLMLDMAEENKRALISGQAGSGKTIVARELCRRRFLEKKRVLYLCFTDALARTMDDSLREEFGPIRPVSRSVRAYAEEMSELEGEAPWEMKLEAASVAARADDRPFDLVVVDEGQDFEAADWAFVEALSGDRSLWVFQDRRQGFWPEREVPGHLSSISRLNLFKQRRNPAEVHALAESYVGGARESLSRGEGVVRVVEQQGPLRDSLDATLKSLFEAGAMPHEIAVLSLAGQTRTKLLGNVFLGDRRAYRADDPAGVDGLIADTFLRFKGLERPFIVVVEPELAHEQADERYETRMHIAITRATAGLVILAPRAAIEKDPRLATLVV